MVALGFREFVAVAESVQADCALARRKVTPRQVFSDQLKGMRLVENPLFSSSVAERCRDELLHIYLDQFKHDRLAQEISALSFGVRLNLIDGYFIQAPGISQTDHWSCVGITGQ